MVKQQPASIGQNKETKGSTFLQGCFGCFGLLFFGLLAVVIIGYFVGNDKGTASTATTSSVTASPDELVNAGEDAVINALAGMAISAVTKDKLDELTNYANANNEDAIQRMMDKGELLSIPSGTLVTVVSRSGGVAEIEITNGDYKGRKVFTYIELIKHK